MPYQLIRSKDTQQARIGSYIKLTLTQKINDSVYFTTGNRLPIYIPVPPQSQPYDISELWTTLHRGDSVIATQMMDTFLKRLPAGNLPPEFKKGDRIITYIKVLGIFARLWWRDGKSGYLDDLPLTLDYVRDTVGRYPELREFGHWLERRIVPVLRAANVRARQSSRA